MNNSCDECIHAKLIDTVNECYMICTNKKYNISFPDYIGKCKYQEKKEIYMYAIQNIKTGKFVYGTDYRYPKPNKKWNQRTSHDRMLTYADYESAKSDFRTRGCGKDYRIVVLKTIEVKRVIEGSDSE